MGSIPIRSIGPVLAAKFVQSKPLLTTDPRRLMRSLCVAPRFRAAALGLLMLPIACSSQGGGDLDSTVVVSVGKAELKGATLAAWLKQSPAPPTAASVGMLVSTWIDQAELATALGEGMTLDDSTTALEVIAPEAAQSVLEEYWRMRATARPKVSDRSVDSLAGRDEVRVFQHLFIDGSKAKDSVAGMAVITKMRAVQTRLKNGESFTTLVREASEDTATIRNNGFLPALTKAELPPEFQAAAWSLDPGETSQVLRSRIGLHMLRRVSAAEAREPLRQWLTPRIGRKADEQYVDSISVAKKLTLASDAVDRARLIAPEPLAVADSAPMASWTGGALSPSRLRVWIALLGPVERVLLSGAADSSTFLFIRETAKREMLLGIIAPGGPNTPEARRSLLPLYRAALDSVLTDVREFAGKDPGQAATAIIEGLVTGQRRYRPLPGALPAVLRSRVPAKVNTVALEAILDAVGPEYAKLHANDSATTTTPQPTQPPGPPRP